MDSSIEIVCKGEDVFRPCRTIFRQLKGGKNSNYNVSAETFKILKLFFWGGGEVQLLADFNFLRDGGGSWILAPLEVRDMYIIYK